MRAASGVVHAYQIAISSGGANAKHVRKIHETVSTPRDGVRRTSPSLGVNEYGDIVIAYYAHDPSSKLPSIRYVGRCDEDPPGRLGQEFTLHESLAPPTAATRASWSATTLVVLDQGDPEDWWVGGEYADAAGGWRSRIGKVSVKCQR